MTDKKVEVVENKEHHHHDENDSDSDHDHEGHNHEGHDHAEHGGEEGKDGKGNRGEKKFKKAMIKLGLKQMTGITRVTIKKGKNLLLYIENPEVFKSPGVENSFIIFGEPKMNDFPGNIASEEAQKFKGPESQVQLEKKSEPEVQQNQGGNEELDESKITADSIKMVMDHCKCDRKAAVQALIESDGDSVNAILKLTG